MKPDGAGLGLKTGTVVVINKNAGSGRAARRWQALEKDLPAGLEVLREDSVAATRAALLERLRAGCRRVLSFGGDGTANLVVDVLLGAGLGQEVDFGIVPAGTASDFARTAGITADPRAALRRALACEQPRGIDAIAVDIEGKPRAHSLNIASAGLSGHVDMVVHSAHGGNYLLATLRGLATYRPRPCRVEVDGEPFFEGSFFVLAMANGKYFGKAMKVAPDAQIDDGLLDVVLVGVASLWHLPFRLPLFYLGRHVNDKPHVRTTKARQIRLTPLAPDFPPYDLDGEPRPAAPATFTILPGALRLLA